MSMAIEATGLAVVPDDSVRLLRRNEVEEKLGISMTKYYELIGSGELPSVKLGGCRRVRSDVLQQFIANLSATDAE